MVYFHRLLEKTVKNYLRLFPVVAVTGPRQSGKSTLLKELFQNEYRYVSFDDPTNIEFFNNDPKGFLKNYSSMVIFDKAQKVPGIFSYIKLVIDEKRMDYGQFILTGSSQFQIHKEITETLAGRIGLLSLLPFQLIESPETLRNELILKGSYPELIARHYAGLKEWYASYIQNYLERDVRNISNIGNLRDFQRKNYLPSYSCFGTIIYRGDDEYAISKNIKCENYLSVFLNSDYFNS